MRSRVGMTEDSVLAASQHRSHPPPLAGQRRVADEIDLGEMADESPNTKPIGNLLVTETEGTKLPMTDRPVLSARKRGDPIIQVVSW